MEYIIEHPFYLVMVLAFSMVFFLTRADMKHDKHRKLIEQRKKNKLCKKQ